MPAAIEKAVSYQPAAVSQNLVKGESAGIAFL
jgi:hypothetical protein